MKGKYCDLPEVDSIVSSWRIELVIPRLRRWKIWACALAPWLVNRSQGWCQSSFLFGDKKKSDTPLNETRTDSFERTHIQILIYKCIAWSITITTYVSTDDVIPSIFTRYGYNVLFIIDLNFQHVLLIIVFPVSVSFSSSTCNYCMVSIYV